jgi:hypothetical protein
MRFSWRIALQWIVFTGIGLFLAVSFSLGEEEFDPDSVAIDERVKQDYNPYMSLYSMNSWTTPVLDHNGKPHKDCHAIQVIADGGNGIQDPPNPDGSPGGDDSLADGNYNIQYVNGKKNIIAGLQDGMFMGTYYYVPYKANQSIYLRLWESSYPATAEYYQDSEEYTTFRGDHGGPIIALQPENVDDVDWKFGPSKKSPNRK